MPSILGPQSANYVTARPSRDTTIAATDTWFVDCTSATSLDGTVVTASWMNDIIAQLRAAIDGAIANGASIARDGENDTMLWEAISFVGAKFTASASAPSNPSVKDLWFSLGDGSLNIYVTDGTMSAWVQIA